MSDKVGMPDHMWGWLRDPEGREYADYVAGMPAPDPDRTCWCGREATRDYGPTWHLGQRGRMVRCDWHGGPGGTRIA